MKGIVMINSIKSYSFQVKSAQRFSFKSDDKMSDYALAMKVGKMLVPDDNNLGERSDKLEKMADWLKDADHKDMSKAFKYAASSLKTTNTNIKK